MDAIEAFDTAEALSMLAHDYGLYAVKSALDDIPFRPSPLQHTYDDLPDEGRAIYDGHTADAEGTADPYSVPDWARTMLDAIRDADEAP